MPTANPWKKDSKESEQASSPEPPNAQSRLKSRSSRGKKEPEPEPEPVPEPASDEESGDHQPGRIKNLAGFFTTQTGEAKVVRRKRLEVADTEDTLVLENEPIERLEGVVRSGDPGEWEKPIELEKGWAKNMASKFLNRTDDDTTSSKKPFVMDLDQTESTIAESEPVVLEGVVRSGDKVKDVMGKRGRIKNIAGRFGTGGSSGGGGASTWDEDDDGVETVGDGYRTDKPTVESGKARNMAERFKQQAEENASSSRNGQTSARPQWMIELENAQEHGVFENEPEVRDDVVRADDDQPDVISVQHTRNLRAMWTQFEKEEMGPKSTPSRRADIIVRPKKEPTPEPEPEPEPEPPPKSRFGAKKYGQSIQNVAMTYGEKDAGKGGAAAKKGAQKEKTPPPAAGGKQQTGKVAAAVKGKQQQPPASPPPEPKDSKTFVKPGLKSVGRKY